jgi:hypothetical protein
MGDFVTVMVRHPPPLDPRRGGLHGHKSVASHEPFRPAGCDESLVAVRLRRHFGYRKPTLHHLMILFFRTVSMKTYFVYSLAERI